MNSFLPLTTLSYMDDANNDDVAGGQSDNDNHICIHSIFIVCPCVFAYKCFMTDMKNNIQSVKLSLNRHNCFYFFFFVFFIVFLSSVQFISVFFMLPGGHKQQTQATDRQADRHTDVHRKTTENPTENMMRSLYNFDVYVVS